MHVASVTIFKPTLPRDDFFALPRACGGPTRSPPLVSPPPRGGMEELRALIAQLHAVPLDRSRPVWEYHFIEGLED